MDNKKKKLLKNNNQSSNNKYVTNILDNIGNNTSINKTRDMEYKIPELVGYCLPDDDDIEEEGDNDE